MKDILFLVVVNALNHFWADKRAFRDNPFEGDHMVQMNRTKGSWVTCEFTEAADESTIVHL